jgi:hypothetical protein
MLRHTAGNRVVRASYHRGLAIALVAATAAAACSSGDPVTTPTSVPATSTSSPSRPTTDPVPTTQTSTPVPGPLLWNQPRTEAAPGVLLLDYGPLEGWRTGRTGEEHGALYPLAADTGARLPSHEPFDVGHH